ncbi:MAG: hypothetical protein KDA60_15095, partial [Planctomycetales bacterium]|nr:hypothetical protein [Planctomycetales bacterium]
FRIAALNDLRKRARREHFAYLNKLRRKLRQDRDPRTNQLAKQLQQLYDRSSRSDPDFDAHREDVPTAVVELFDQSTQLYQSCLDLLERSFQLWMTAKEMATDEGRTRTLDTREKLIGEVETSVHRLHDTFDRIYSAQAGATEIDTAENAELRAELERGLDVARQVEARMESLEKELRFKERA